MRPDPADQAPRFLADVMLGRLAKWLRILGFDVEYDNRIDDDTIVRRCRQENRIALTADSRLVTRRLIREQSLLLTRHDLLGQLQTVMESLQLQVNPERLLTRCIECNLLLEQVAREQVQGEVPAYVLKTQERFKRCPGCRRIYWQGTHRSRILQALGEWGN